ncbi:ABC transporter substrate-binding protein [Streptomyces sp. NBC_01275]|uniref:bifunctional serine/threonine-protein kinase/ABC transporter substrate-binding protein n=1 Tax=Streptomyces sp. NBC_01275 TaxID=2903807 RepID=UPI0022589B55|nr:ABC transporter substrate-binding protein [Streptomyces sp. NBC_01275]MCX4760255.1 ABC transporter substrate-binding protein [Streptomyces sp. NBC_01275]
MEPLRASDPAKLAGHRLLGRLGAGGMGVVYLARTAGGTLVALKVIQAEYAEDPDFRERFRREADTARRMTSPWVAALVDADPEAAQPWLATAFVPGPSLGEAVAECGPFPARSLRVLGARLAEALRDLHAVGLVHRDVKPGNVLLALDGPRLIDFGVARDPADTALTSTGVVVGTPGFLSPEQARGGRDVGPAGDVFSLGCVLAYAATGRPPFGTGALDALLYRAVHDAPDLEGVPREIAGAVGDCLEKDPLRRPTAEALRENLTTALADADALAADPRTVVLRPEPKVTPASPADPREALRAPRAEVASGAEAGELPGDASGRLTEGEAEGSPDGERPVDDTPVDGTPVDEPPADEPPVDDTPVDDTPVDEPPVDEVPADETPGAETPGDQALGDEAAWLPEPLVRLIAERSAAGLALPGVDDTEVDGAASDSVTEPAAAPPPGRAVGRRRLLLLAGGAAAVTAGGGLAAWAALSGDGEDKDGGKGSGAARPAYAIGLHADLTGDQKEVGQAQENGLRLAVEQFNARADQPFTLAVKTVDDGGDPAAAPAAAARLVADRSVLAVIGPTTDATAQASLLTYDAALLPLVAVSPGATVLSVLGSRSFLHARVTDTILPFYLSAYLRGTAKSRAVGIVDDRAADAYSWEISSQLSRVLRDARLPAVPKVVSALRTDFGPTLDALLADGADSLVFAGYHDRAALLARELGSRAFTGARAAAEGVLDPRFLSAAGDAAEGWVVVAPVMDSSVDPAAKTFATAYRKRFGADPQRYAVEAYDVAQLTLKTMSGLPAGDVTRAHLTTALRSATYKGITKNFAFDKKTGGLVIDGGGVFLWQVIGGRFRYRGAAPYQVST